MFSKRNPRGSGGGHLDKKINALFRKLDKMRGTAKEGSAQYMKILRDLQVLTRERVSSPLPNPLLQTVLMGNPPVEVPFREGERIPVAKARAWVESTGDQELIRQFRKAEAIQKKANRAPKTVVWKTIPIGSPNELDMVTAMVHYGKSPETLYRAPKGSKKGQHMYRHEWGDGTGKEKSVDVLAAAGGGAMVMPLNKGQTIDDWMRG